MKSKQRKHCHDERLRNDTNTAGEQGLQTWRRLSPVTQNVTYVQVGGFYTRSFLLLQTTDKVSVNNRERLGGRQRRL